MARISIAIILFKSRTSKSLQAVECPWAERVKKKNPSGLYPGF
jgi:hypothetical protein